ncbi:MAG: hypothetical protein KGO52_14835 [Nitrospirota bacterium]|nr:hypothetical protein [Nitrospirota bacterium]MDE3243984.1 hypothetical protein [Nitrospirota bacterium]
MRHHLGISRLALCVTVSVAWFIGPAAAQNLDPSSVLYDSASVLREQQEVESKLAASRARLQDLQFQEGELNRQASENESDRSVTSTSCSTAQYYYTHRSECTSGSDRLSSDAGDIARQQSDIADQIRTTNAEVEQLTNRRQQLLRQGESMESKLKRLEISGTSRECLDRQSASGLQDMVSAYERCWDRSSASQPRFKPEPSNAPTLTPGPIEQMGIEDEQRRRRKARQKELSGE